MSTKLTSFLFSTLGALCLAPAWMSSAIEPGATVAIAADDDDGGNGGSSSSVCEETAELQLESAMAELEEELRVQQAVCLNLSDPQARRDCLRDARLTRRENRQLAFEIFDARIALCELLGGGRYDPQVDPANFVSVIDNPYLPFPVGAHWIYQSLTDEGLETIEVNVMPETREILGVECVSVRDVVTLDGEPIEDTTDWYAQDTSGNVWYFGEIALNFEDGFIADIAGSWLAGVDGAKPGIVMLADPTPGVTYRQEWFLGEAEDAATILADGVTVNIGIGRFVDCVQTGDFLPPEPSAFEHKFFAPGIGFLFETKPGSSETLELVSYSGL